MLDGNTARTAPLDSAEDNILALSDSRYMVDHLLPAYDTDAELWERDWEDSASGTVAARILDKDHYNTERLSRIGAGNLAERVELRESIRNIYADTPVFPSTSNGFVARLHAMERGLSLLEDPHILYTFAGSLVNEIEAGRLAALAQANFIKSDAKRKRFKRLRRRAGKVKRGAKKRVESVKKGVKKGAKNVKKRVKGGVESVKKGARRVKTQVKKGVKTAKTKVKGASRAVTKRGRAAVDKVKKGAGSIRRRGKKTIDRIRGKKAKKTDASQGTDDAATGAKNGTDDSSTQRKSKPLPMPPRRDSKNNANADVTDNGAATASRDRGTSDDGQDDDTPSRTRESRRGTEVRRESGIRQADEEDFEDFSDIPQQRVVRQREPVRRIPVPRRDSVVVIRDGDRRRDEMRVVEDDDEVFDSELDEQDGALDEEDGEIGDEQDEALDEEDGDIGDEKDNVFDEEDVEIGDEQDNAFDEEDADVGDGEDEDVGDEQDEEDGDVVDDEDEDFESQFDENADDEFDEDPLDDLFPLGRDGGFVDEPISKDEIFLGDKDVQTALPMQSGRFAPPKISRKEPSIWNLFGNL